MKRTVQELANETDTASLGMTTVQGSEWLDSILATAKQKMYFEQFASVFTVPKGNKDLSAPIATSHLTFTSISTEATARTFTEVTNVTTVTFTPVTAKYGARISKDVLRTTRVDILKWAREEMAYSVAVQVDQAIVTAIDAEASPAATLYGGDADSTGTLESGDILTTDLVAKAQRYLKANGWVSEKDKPFVLVIPAVCEEAFLKDSQFVNASEYGGDEVVMNGEIGKYLGCKVVVSEQCTSASNWGGGSLAGHKCYLFKSKVAYGIAYGEKATLDSEYRKNEAAWDIYLDIAYQADTLQGGALVIINVSDA
jgi:N4-gp56 family major capsid protein